MKLVIGSDHGGYGLKEVIKQHLASQGHEVEDIGCDSSDPVDYPDFAANVARRVAQGRAELGIMIDGAGIGSSMAANKIKGVRAACCNDLYTVVNSREHNHANVLTMGSMVVGPGVARKLVNLFIATLPAGGRHEGRVKKINALENGAFESGSSMSEDGLHLMVSTIVDRLLGKSDLTASAGPGVTSSPPVAPSAAPARTETGLITEEMIRTAVRKGQRELVVATRAIVTPLAKDTARDLGLAIRRV